MRFSSQAAAHTLSAQKLKALVENIPAALPQNAEGRRLGAVLAIFLEFEGEASLLFTKRAAGLDEHAGQISFPGGAVEKNDPDFKAAALRETFEEVSIRAAELDFMGRLPSQPVLDSWLIHPFAAWWPRPRPLRHNPSEVAKIIIHPIADLLRQHKRESWLLPGPDFCRYDLGGENLWGATARIVGRFLDVWLGFLKVSGLRQSRRPEIG